MRKITKLTRATLNQETVFRLDLENFDSERVENKGSSSFGVKAESTYTYWKIKAGKIETKTVKELKNRF